MLMLRSLIISIGRHRSKNVVPFGTNYLVNRRVVSTCQYISPVVQSAQSQIVKNQFHTCSRLNCLQIEPRMSISFKCNVCNNSSTKTFSKEAYQKGMVIISCPCCQSKHLIANNIPKYKDLGLGNIEDFLTAKGEEVKRGLQITGMEQKEDNMETPTILQIDQKDKS